MQRDTTSAWILGAALGAAAMYFLDPRSGRRRRAQLRDRAVHLAHVLEGSAEQVAQDAAHRARGTVARVQQRTSSETVDDQRLAERVRSRLGHVASNASKIRVQVHDGNVRLEGPVRSDEMGDVLSGIRRVGGVRSVESALQPIEGTRGTLAQRARGMARGLDRPLSPAARGVIGLAGGALALLGIRRGGTAGTLAAAAGAWMVTRAVTNLETPKLAGVRRHTVAVQKSLEIAAPVSEVFAYWSSFRNFPQFMQHLREVRETESGISHWTAEGPAGIPATWDAELTALQPHRRIAWRSLPGSLVENAGEVRFEEVDENHTRIHVRMAYGPPAGVFGHAVMTLFGADPRRQLDEDLYRFKRLLEEGTVRARGRQVVRQEVAPPAQVEPGPGVSSPAPSP